MPPTAAAPTRTPDRIEKSAEFRATVSRVWRALTDHNEFGAWFRVKLMSPSKSARNPMDKSSTRAMSTSHGAR
jgi:uncharacterized protein YndB with AHSA1/START domain